MPSQERVSSEVIEELHPRFGVLAKYFELEMLEAVWNEFKIKSLFEWQI